MRLMLQRVARITFDRVSTLGRSGHGSTGNIRRLFDDETISHASNGHFQNVDNERNERKKNKCLYVCGKFKAGKNLCNAYNTQTK